MSQFVTYCQEELLANEVALNYLTKDSGLKPRTSLVVDTNYAFKYDDAPRERDFRKWVVYQLHVGSFTGARNTSAASVPATQG